MNILSTAKTLPEEIFKVGDYFTGVDRKSYPRSLYEYLGKNSDGSYRCRQLFLNGRVGCMEIPFKSYHFKFGDYRLANKEEVKTYLDNKRCESEDNYDPIYRY